MPQIGPKKWVRGASETRCQTLWASWGSVGVHNVHRGDDAREVGCAWTCCAPTPLGPRSCGCCGGPGSPWRLRSGRTEGLDHAVMPMSWAHSPCRRARDIALMPMCDCSRSCLMTGLLVEAPAGSCVWKLNSLASRLAVASGLTLEQPAVLSSATDTALDALEAGDTLVSPSWTGSADTPSPCSSSARRSRTAWVVTSGFAAGSPGSGYARTMLVVLRSTRKPHELDRVSVHTVGSLVD